MKAKVKQKALLAGTLSTGLAASASAATVQITLTGNMLSTTGGNQMVADLTGDSVNDVTITGVNAGLSFLRGVINGNAVFAYQSAGSFTVDAQFAAGGVGTASAVNGTPRNINYLNPISFTDSRINSGVATDAWLQVNAFNTGSFNQTVALTRLIYDDASTTRPGFGGIPGTQPEWAAVPEPSGMALLALGAGGLLVRRRGARASRPSLLS